MFYIKDFTKIYNFLKAHPNLFKPTRLKTEEIECDNLFNENKAKFESIISNSEKVFAGSTNALPPAMNPDLVKPHKFKFMITDTKLTGKKRTHKATFHDQKDILFEVRQIFDFSAKDSESIFSE